MKFRPLSLLSVLLLFFNLFSGPSHSRTALNVWDVLRAELSLNHEVTQPQVQAQLRWLLSHPSYVQELAKAEPYIYHIVTEIKKRKLPGELALIPMIESTYDPFAYSGVGAAGLWQLMPMTGSELGLKRDWWFDGRRSIGLSTAAALNYLTYLNKFFNGNWALAIAAYDCGEGTIARAIRNGRQSSSKARFWSLSVPRETQAYVPRLLALAEIIKNPQRYKINLPDIPHIPYFEEVNIGSQIDLNHAAKLAGISYKELIKLNPGYNRWATAPYKPFNLLIPIEKVAYFNRNLANIPQEKRVSWTRHQVRNGENLGSIAKHYFTTAKLICELNQLTSSKLKTGQYVLIPSLKNTAVAKVDNPPPPAISEQLVNAQNYKIIHIVQTGETYKSLEKKYQVTKANIRLWNNINQKSNLKKGQQLTLWRPTTKYGIYIVKEGDNINNIAKRHNIQPTILAKLNPNIINKPLQAGQKVVIG